MSNESAEFVEAFRTSIGAVRERIIERACFVPDLLDLAKTCASMALPGHAATVYQFLVEEYGVTEVPEVEADADVDFYQEIYDLVGKREQPAAAKGAPLSQRQLGDLGDAVHQARVATYASRDGEKQGAAIYLQIAGALRDWGRPELGLAFARRAAFLSPRDPDARPLCGELRAHRTDLSERLYLQFRDGPPMEVLLENLERKVKKAKAVEPFDKLAKRIAGSAPNFEARFGALALGDQTVVEQVNQFRHMFATEVAPTIDAKPPSALRGHMTNWGWFSEGETAAEQDWDERLKAWDLATQLAEQAREGGLLRGSDADCPYGAFVTLAPRSSSLKDTKPRLGLEANEMLECDYDLGDQLAGAERIAYLLFFGYDALSDGVDKWVSSEDQKAARQVAATMDQHLKDVRLLSMDRSEKSDGRYVCSPEYGLGLTSSGKYLVGLWAYVVQS